MPSSSDVALGGTTDFALQLIAWQARAGRHQLPWQNTGDPYRIWLSEIMLQQTQVAAVIPYYQRFLARFPTVEALAHAPLDDVMAAWAGLGYYSRARNLHRCAREVALGLAGQWPRTLAGLHALPGIGRSTAAAIAVFAFGAREAILDGNVKRVLCRVFGIDRPMQKATTEKELTAIAERLLPETEVAAYTQGLMDFGATLCTPRNPHCAACPFAEPCVARATGRIAELPRPRQKKVVPLRASAFALLRCGDAIWLERRPATGIWGGLWCLPEMKEEGALISGAEFASRRAQDLGASAAHGPVQEVARFRHAFTHYVLDARVFAVDVAAPSSAAEGAWVTAAECARLGLPTPIAALVTSAAWPEIR